MDKKQPTEQITRRGALRSGLVAGAVAVAGCLGGPSPEKQVNEARDALKKYSDVAKAIEDGYVTTGKYVRDGGLLGIPFINYDAPTLEKTKPTVLFYDLTDDGMYELVGAEWYVPADERDSPPSLFGKTFHDAQPGHAPGQPRHYGLHVWAFSDNPDGLFAAANPSLTPPAFLDTLGPVRDQLRQLQLGSRAEEQGYRNTEKCIQLPNGYYGVPFVNTSTDSTTDPASPPVLLYQLSSSWSYVLLGAEWYVPASETESAPTLFEQPFHDPMAGHSPKTDQPEHYGLHAWLFRANPQGMFSVSLPGETC